MKGKKWINAGYAICAAGALIGAYLMITHRENAWGVLLVSLAFGEVIMLIDSKLKDKRIKELEKQLENKKD